MQNFQTYRITKGHDSITQDPMSFVAVNEKTRRELVKEKRLLLPNTKDGELVGFSLLEYNSIDLPKDA